MSPARIGKAIKQYLHVFFIQLIRGIYHECADALFNRRG
jgi:hypothetical protein